MMNSTLSIFFALEGDNIKEISEGAGGMRVFGAKVIESRIL